MTADPIVGELGTSVFLLLFHQLTVAERDMAKLLLLHSLYFIRVCFTLKVFSLS